MEAVRAKEIDIGITAPGSRNYFRVGWRKKGGIGPLTFGVVSFANSPAVVTIPGLEAEADYEIRVYLITRQAFDLYRGGNSGSTGDLIPDITPSGKWVRNLTSGGHGKSQILTETTIAPVNDHDDDDHDDDDDHYINTEHLITSISPPSVNPPPVNPPPTRPTRRDDDDDDDDDDTTIITTNSNSNIVAISKHHRGWYETQPLCLACHFFFSVKSNPKLICISQIESAILFSLASTLRRPIWTYAIHQTFFRN